MNVSGQHNQNQILFWRLWKLCLQCTLSEQNISLWWGVSDAIHGQRDTQIHSEKGVILKKTSLEKNKVKRAAARHRWPSLAAAAHKRLLWASPTQTLMLTLSPELFLPFSGLIMWMKVIPEHVDRRFATNLQSMIVVRRGWCVSICLRSILCHQVTLICEMWGSGYRRDTHSPHCEKQTFVSSRWLWVTCMQTTFLLSYGKLAERHFFVVVVVVLSRSNKRPHVRPLHSWLCLIIFVVAGRHSLKSLSMHKIVCVCARARVAKRCFIFHAHKEMSDKMATVCLASLLDLNVCVWCQFTSGPDTAEGSGRLRLWLVTCTQLVTSKREAASVMNRRWLNCRLNALPTRENQPLIKCEAVKPCFSFLA